MQTQPEVTLPQDTDPVVQGILADSYTSFPPEFAHVDPATESEPLDVMDMDMNSWTATVQGPIVNEMLSESTIEALLQDIEEYEANNATHPMPALPTSGASTNSQLMSPGGPSVAAPVISSEFQSYICSWNLHQSGVKCNHGAPDRQSFLQHLADVHLVSGNEKVTYTCQLSDSRTDSACNKPRKRGNFPRHVDTHYRKRYHCQYCPPGTSYARLDTWKKHMRNNHG